MKNIKKLLALVLALAICAAFAVPALADGDQTTTGNRLVLNDAVDGHEYILYQVFSGDLYEGVLSNIKYGSAWGAPKVGTDVEDSVLGEITGANNNSTAADQFARKYIDQLTIPFDSQGVKEGGTITWSNLPAGYYLVKDDGEINGDIEGDTISAFIVKVVGVANATPKTTKTTLDKTVQDKKGAFSHAVDQAVGKEFQFKLTATVPTKELFQYSLSDPGDYTLKFHDEMSVGLDFVKFDSLKIGSDVKTDFSFPTVGEGVRTFDVSFDLFALIKSGEKVSREDINKYGDNIIVEITYTAKLNENAVVYPAMGDDNKPNWNKANLEYRNNPNSNGDGDKGTTPDKEVYVYTFKIEGSKVNEENETLAGAEFELYKAVTADDGTVSNGELVGTLTTKDDGEISFEGLEAGKYVLVEKTAPQGYNKMQDMIIEITAEYNDTTKEITYTQIATQGGENCTSKENEEDGNPVWNVINKPGSLLPSTGGIGTTIFYIVGAVLVVGAGVLLFTKRRTSN